MKKLRKKLSRVIGLVLAMAMMLSVGTGVMAEDNGQPDEFSLRVGHMLGAVAQDAQTMGMAGVNFDNLYLGECVYTENGISFYPIFEGENPTPVATISTWLDKSGERQLQFGAGASMALAENSSVSNKFATKLYVVSTYATTGKSLSVPIVGQGNGTDLCWAACISSTGLYRNKPYKSPEQVAATIGKGDVKATLTEMNSAMYAAFQLSSTTYYGGLYINTIMNSINSDKPVITWTAVDNHQGGQGWGHAVLINGYVYNGSALDSYVTFMDPDGGGSSQMTTVSQNFSYTFYYSGNPDPYMVRQAYGYLYLNS